ERGDPRSSARAALPDPARPRQFPAGDRGADPDRSQEPPLQGRRAAGVVEAREPRAELLLPRRLLDPGRAPAELRHHRRGGAGQAHQAALPGLGRDLPRGRLCPVAEEAVKGRAKILYGWLIRLLGPLILLVLIVRMKDRAAIAQAVAQASFWPLAGATLLNFA